jgi:D-erythrulose 1-phosphate 3-epimerase
MKPRLHLAVDNCFASKRWVEPGEWMDIAAKAGIYCIEASADNECDPLYSTPEVLDKWLKTIQEESARTGVRVVNFYSGHGSYATLGLAHPDTRVRDHIQYDWLQPMIQNAASLGAGLGFFCHAFSQAVLKDPARYAEAKTDLYRRLGELAQFAAGTDLTEIGVEQMYSPHQFPWTIAGTHEVIETIYAQSGAPMYITLDTGHQVGQPHYQRPTREQITAYVAALRQGETPPATWIGLAEIDLGDDDAALVDELLAYCEAHPHLFTAAEDGELYTWLRELGAYSPIIHLQQTDGTASGHRPFIEAYNQTGIVTPERVFAALNEAYEKPATENSIPYCSDIYLTLEVFSGTAQTPHNIIANLEESAAYWREYLPEDGLTLDQVLGV